MIGDFMQAVRRELAPEGTMRVAVHYGNPVIAHHDAASGQPRGLAADLSEALARRLALPRTLLNYESAGQAFEAGLAGAWDLAFLAVDPVRSRSLDFTRPFLVLEGSYLVAAGAPQRTALELDHEGITIAIVEGSFHDHHLARTLRHARLVRSRTGAEAVARFLAEKLDAVAGLKPTLAAVAAAHPGLRVIEGRYAAVGQAIALPKGRAAALKYLDAFLKDATADGRIEAAKGSQA